ncbi:MAG: 3-oxoacyl-ACP reductase [Firmicutes bacterium HGW-Firmicutes-12]|nr:MAG: 3-oxoacyl-ACP reductase [Firmicutes bacterium HGW-Firmicutes-12]
MKLKNKVAIVTGAGKGIGETIAKKFALEGAKVMCCARNIEQVNKVVNDIIFSGGEAMGFKVDVSKKSDVEDMVQSVLDQYQRIDILVNNAGVIDDAQLKNMNDEQYDKVIDINLKGTYNCARAVVNTMIAQNAGAIINTSSVVGIYGNFGQTNYAASKFGVIGFTKTWAKELGKHNIRCNAICPGFIATSILDPMPAKVIKALEDKVPLKRLGQPEEIANVFAFLASEEASYMNGAILEVTGGLVI